MPAEIKSAPCPGGLIHILGETLPQVTGGLGEGWVVLKTLCEGMGLNWSGERSRLKHDAKFTPMMMPLLGTDGKRREMLCLPITQLHGWLLSINGARVDEGLRDRVMVYQRESLAALNGYWGDASPGPVAEVASESPRPPASTLEPHATGESSMASLESRVKNVMRDLLGDFSGSSSEGRTP